MQKGNGHSKGIPMHHNDVVYAAHRCMACEPPQMVNQTTPQWAYYNVGVAMRAWAWDRFDLCVLEEIFYLGYEFVRHPTRLDLRGYEIHPTKTVTFMRQTFQYIAEYYDG